LPLGRYRGIKQSACSVAHLLLYALVCIQLVMTVWCGCDVAIDRRRGTTAIGKPILAREGPVPAPKLPIVNVRYRVARSDLGELFRNLKGLAKVTGPL